MSLNGTGILGNKVCIAVSLLWLIFIGSIVFLCSGIFFDDKLVPKWLAFALFGMASVLYNSVRQFKGGRGSIKAFCDMQTMLVVICVVISVESFYGILQYLGITGFAEGTAVSGSYDNPAGFAATISAALPYIMIGNIHQGKSLRLLSQLAFIFAVIAISLSESRAGIVSVGAVFVLGAHKFMIKRPVVKWSLIAVWMLIFVLFVIEKPDSLSGRLLIWCCSLRMIKERWLFGYGPGGFESHYMDFQACYLEQHPESVYGMLADTVQYPFNEYLHILSNYGVVGLLLVFLYLGYMVYRYMKNRTPERLAALLGILSVSVFSMFSYPLMYPFVWFVLIYGSAILLSGMTVTWQIGNSCKRACALVSILLCCYGIYRLCVWSEAEIRWKHAAESGMYGIETLSEYDKLYGVLCRDRYFMYNYAYVLYRSGAGSKADDIVTECRSLWADYDVEMLSGMIAERNCLVRKAASHYMHASNMCPNRFRPLYRLMRLYDAEEDIVAAAGYARRIVDKPVKIDSPEIHMIKREAETYLRGRLRSLDLSLM